MKKQCMCSIKEVADIENLLEAWREFKRGKCNKPDVEEFSLHLMDNLFALREDLLHHTYRHSGYQAFRISDPKPRSIHKATVRDRILHRALYRKLYPFFDTTFITDSFSCRVNKGTHRALRRYAEFGREASLNNRRTCWVLKCDIKKFFASIDHAVLFDILQQYLPDDALMNLIKEIIESFSSTAPGIGLPLGNLTSQLFGNVYMNEFDQFMKHRLKAVQYIRYADDFVILSHDRLRLTDLLSCIEEFLFNRLKLRLHPDKVFIKTLASGVDFLGWIHFPDHHIVRTATRRRMMRRLTTNLKPGMLESYVGLLSHGNAGILTQNIIGNFNANLERGYM